MASKYANRLQVRGAPSFSRYSVNPRKRIARKKTGATVTGLKKIKREIAILAQKLTLGSTKGIKKVAKKVERNVGWSGGHPLIPVKTGALRRSWFSVPYKPRGQRSRAIRFGYRKRYAHVQHNPEDYFSHYWYWKYTRPNSGRIYLTSSVQKMAQTGDIIKTVERHLRYQIRRK